MNGKEQRIAKLHATQEQRKEDCLDRVEKTIAKLLQSNERISFGAVARGANVSVSYLYKYPELKERIQDLRNQQIKNVKQLTRPQTASEKSKQVIIQQLRERISNLEWEKKELSKQNEKMTGQLYEIGRSLDLLDRLKTETKRQAEEIQKLRTELEKITRELEQCQEQLIVSNPKVTPLEKKRNQSLVKSEISNDLKNKLLEQGIKLNSTLKKLMESKSEDVIKNVLIAVKEYQLTSKKPIRSLASLFRTALEEEWMPNETDENTIEANVHRSAFSEWYDLAREYGIVIGFKEENGVILIEETTRQWQKYDDFSAKWTLDYLRQWKNRSK